MNVIFIEWTWIDLDDDRGDDRGGESLLRDDSLMRFDDRVAVPSSWSIDGGCLEVERPSLAEKSLLTRRPILLFWERAAFATAFFLSAGARPLGIASGFHSFYRIRTLLV